MTKTMVTLSHLGQIMPRSSPAKKRFEELVQAAYDRFDQNYHAWQDDLAQEFEKWKQLQTQSA